MRPKNYIDLTGQRFGKLVVIGRAPNGNCGQTRWMCECDCGNLTSATSQHLRAGNTKSCGCGKAKFTAEFNRATKTSHGGASHTNRSRLYKIYTGMKSRCFQKHSRAYKDYGGRGITICNEWLGEHGFENFRDWSLSHGYRDDLTIDRIDNDGNYSPENCRWVTMKQQTNNTRRNRYLTLNGETHTATEWGEITGINRITIVNRCLAGWTDEEALTIPVGTYQHPRGFRQKQKAT